MAANYIKKEDVSTDNIYEYEYADGAFSGYWLKFKYAAADMDTRDPFNPVQNDNAYAVYDAYIFESEVRAVTNLIDSIFRDKAVDFFYVEESVYQAIAEDNAEFLVSYRLIPYQITDNIMTVNKYYLPADFDITDWETEPEEPEDPDEPVTVVYVTQSDNDVYGDYNINLYDINEDPLTYGIEYTGHTSSPVDFTMGDVNLGIITSTDYNDGTEWCALSMSQDYIYCTIYNGTEYISCGVFVLPENFDLSVDHTYGFALAVDTSEIGVGQVSFVPQLFIDNSELTNLAGTGDFIDTYSPMITFDVSGGTDSLNSFMQSFISNIWMFRYTPNGDSPREGYSPIDGINWEISEVKILYMDGTDITNIGNTQERVFTAVNDKTLSDGTNTYTLQPMMNIINLISKKNQ